MLAVPVLAISLRGNANSGKQSAIEIEQTVRQALREAMTHNSFLLLTAGFFVCGFQVAFMVAHFPAYVSDIGLDPRFAVLAIALIGFFNIFGSLGAGIYGQRHSKPMFLVGIMWAGPLQ